MGVGEEGCVVECREGAEVEWGWGVGVKKIKLNLSYSISKSSQYIRSEITKSAIDKSYTLLIEI